MHKGSFVQRVTFAREVIFAHKKKFIKKLIKKNKKYYPRVRVKGNTDS